MLMLGPVRWGPGVPRVGVAEQWRRQPDGGLAALRAGMGRLERWAGVEVRPAQEVDGDASALWEHFRSAVGPMRDAIAGLTEEPQRRVLNAVLDQFDELLQSYDQVSGRLVRRVSVDGNPDRFVAMPSWQVAVGLDVGQRAAGTGVSASGVFSGQASLPLS
jgi:hypothetical protein